MPAKEGRGVRGGGGGGVVHKLEKGKLLYVIKCFKKGRERVYTSSNFH